MSIESFRRKAKEKIDDAHVQLQGVEQRAYEKKMDEGVQYGDTTKEVGQKWLHLPLSIDVDRINATVLPVYLNRIENQSELDRKYPNLNEETPVGEITILPVDEERTPYAKDKSIQKAGFALLKDVKARLQELALAIQHGDPTVANVEYFYGLSRLANIADKFGFDSFDMADTLGKDSVSHLWAKRSYELTGDEGGHALVDKKEAKLAIISREELLRRFGTPSLGLGA